MEDTNNYVLVSLKKSSSKDGGIGHDIDVCATNAVSEAELQSVAERALKVALKVEAVLMEKRR